MKKENIVLTVFSGILAVSLFLLVFSGNGLTGYATQSSTTSNVTITKYFSMSLSQNLSDGITFGSVSSLPSYDINASDNNNSASGGSSLYVNVSTDSNTAVDFCVQANSGLYDSTGGTTIGIGNQTYLNSTTTSGTLPGPTSSSVPISLTSTKASNATYPGGTTYYRFWLDIPAATSSGSYNNSVTFKGVETGQAC